LLSKMPVPWALGNHGHRFDRFTSRCRIPEEIFQKRSDSDSTHMVCCDERNREYLYLCKAALAPDMTSTSISFDSSVAVPHTLSETWDFFPEKIQSYGTICFCWLPSNSIANASSITLELCSPRDENKYMNHSFIEDMIRHQFILHESAVINVRVPDHSKIKESDTTPIDCVQLRVTSTFPLKTFVRVGVTTRLIFLEKPSPAFCLPKKSTQEAEIIDLGGLWKELEALKDIIMLRSFLEESGMFTSSIDIPSGVLLYGPSGVGKTLLVRTLVKLCANKLDLSLKTINSGEIMSSGNGGVEHELRKAFMEAKLHGARSKTSCAVIFIDEIEVLCPIRECGRALHSRIVGQMLTLMDGIKKRNREKVIVIAATNLPNSIDPALRRAGRFDREIFVSPPDYKSRRDIFKLHLRYIPFHRNDSALIREQHIDQLATESVGFVGADIAAFCREALRIAQIRNLVSLDYDLKDAWWLKHEMTKEPSTMLSEKVCAAAWVSTPIILPPWYLVRVCKYI
jgi:ATP-dependent 26S proteasome regulatory subunit